ncbi:MAG: YceI family protein [Steroidobacteraceae bacterium]
MAIPLRLRFCAALLALLPCAAVASVWQDDEHSGALQFFATQAGGKFPGHFGKFRVRLDFDPAMPEKGHLDVTIATKSADTADVERDEVLHGKDFFWVERFPEARYHAEGFKRDGKGWIAAGELTLRGVTQPVAVRFEVNPKVERLGMKGGVTLRRLEFGVGQGDWAETTWLGDAVEVAFDLSLTPATAAVSP